LLSQDPFDRVSVRFTQPGIVIAEPI